MKKHIVRNSLKTKKGEKSENKKMQKAVKIFKYIKILKSKKKKKVEKERTMSKKNHNYCIFCDETYESPPI